MRVTSEEARSEAMKRAVALFLLAPMMGCQVYVPLGTPRPEPGQTIRAEVSPRVAEELGGRLGPRYSAIEGQVLTNRDGIVYMAAGMGFTADGGQHVLGDQLLEIPLAEMQGLQERRVSVWRSAVFGVGVLAGVYAFSAAFGIDVLSLIGESESDEPPDKGGGKT